MLAWRQNSLSSSPALSVTTPLLLMLAAAARRLARAGTAWRTSARKMGMLNVNRGALALLAALEAPE